MKYKVLGPRILVKVKKFRKKDIEQFEGSILYRADVSSDTAMSETTNQCVGQVVELGTTAYKRKDSGCDGTNWVEVGQTIHFSRYGAIRLASEEDDEFEFWVLMDKDPLVIEQKDEAQDNV